MIRAKDLEVFPTILALAMALTTRYPLITVGVLLTLALHRLRMRSIDLDELSATILETLSEAPDDGMTTEEIRARVASKRLAPPSLQVIEGSLERMQRMKLRNGEIATFVMRRGNVWVACGF